MNYGKKMKEIRNENNILQNDIAKILKISNYTYSHYETKDTIIPINHLVNFCSYFNVSLDYIFEFSNIKNYPNNNKEINIDLSKKRLKELRKTIGVSQSKFASLFNTANTTISGYELGTRIIATPFLYEICKKYQISADYLLGKIDNPKYLK